MTPITTPAEALEAADDDLIRRGDARIVALEYISATFDRDRAIDAIRSLAAKVQPVPTPTEAQVKVVAAWLLHHDEGCGPTALYAWELPQHWRDEYEATARALLAELGIGGAK